MEDENVLPWECFNCGNKWVDNLFTTWIECPECGGEAGHHQVRPLEANDEWYFEEE